MEETKSCSKCGEVKPISAFRRENTVKSGRRADCRACCAKREQTYRQSYFEKDLIEWKLKMLLVASKRRAREAGVDHDIDLNYLREILSERCPYLGTKFHWEATTGCGQKNPHPLSPSIDKIDSSKGYIKGNVAIVSYRANSIKHNATEEELFRIGRALSLLKAEMAFPD